MQAAQKTYLLCHISYIVSSRICLRIRLRVAYADTVPAYAATNLYETYMKSEANPVSLPYATEGFACAKVLICLTGSQSKR